MGTLNLQPPIGSRETGHYDEPRNGRLHKGIDYHAHLGNAVVASETGKVVRAANNPVDSTVDPKTEKPRRPRAYGNVIVIDHTPLAAEGERHIYTLYAHLSVMGASARETFRKGVTIGLSGDTGRAKDQPHLHFEVIDSGTEVRWSSLKGAMCFEGDKDRENPNNYFRNEIEVKGTVVDGIRQMITDAVKQRLEFVPRINLKRRNPFWMEVWLDEKNIGYLDKDNQNIRLVYSYDLDEELRKMGA